ncbi:MAG: TlpA disulfide reductase family protein [Myxococcota bacterium]
MSEAPAERSRGALFLLGAVFAAAGLWFVVGNEGGSEPVVRGARAPGFSLQRLAEASQVVGAEGDRISLDSLAGRVVLVNFWATWCEPCEQEMPAMERLYRALPRDRFELLAVSIDDEPGKVADFAARYALTFPVLLDPGKQVAERYQTMGVPESILVDRNGRVVERYVGPREWDAPEYVERIEVLFESGPEGSDVPAAGAAAPPGPSVEAPARKAG